MKNNQITNWNTIFNITAIITTIDIFVYSVFKKELQNQVIYIYWQVISTFIFIVFIISAYHLHKKKKK